MADTPPPPPPPSSPPPPPPPGGGAGFTPPPPPGGGGAPGFAAPTPAPGPQAASSRNRIAGLVALGSLALVLIGTVLAIVEFDFGEASESINGWSGDINDGPIHLVVALAPAAAAIARCGAPSPAGRRCSCSSSR